MVRVSHKK
ncbi:Hypothetical protein LLA12_00680 [Lactococcus lactis subsp. lactis]|nr:Hypothetical protein LLA12_00680 [Lactococcus lactis subsp. lactis]